MVENPKNKKELLKQASEFLKNLDPENLTNKVRMSIPPQEMPSQSPKERIKNINEVALGYYPEQAKLEAYRCLQCKNAPCIKGCPVNIDIPSFIKALAEEDYQKSIDIIKENSLLPAICGRVCPQETQCQLYCTIGKIFKDCGKSVSIGRLERFVADWERKKKEVSVPDIKEETGKKVAVIGSGPAGLVVSADVRREGHHVTLFEAFHKTGGVMTYGIPEFRLPKTIVKEEIETLEKMGVKIQTNFVAGKTRKIRDLISKDGYSAVFLGVGAGTPKFLNIEGEEFVGVYTANEYLTRANLMNAYDKNADTPIAYSKRVAVIGGGNVAMDAARTALRLGAEEVHIFYRRTEKEMPARIEEKEHAKEEGVQFHLLQNAKRIIGDKDQNVTAVEIIKHKLGEPDSSGRRRPIPIDGSEFTFELDTVIVAIGNDPNPLLTRATDGLKTNKWGNIEVDKNQETSIERVYAGGDIVLGSATVIEGMGEGRNAAKSINKLLAQEESK